MKKSKTNNISLVLLLVLVIGNVQISEAQFLKKLKKRVKNTAEETALRKTEEKVTKETERTFDTIIDGKIVKRKRKVKKQTSKKPNSGNKEFVENESFNESLRLWSKYNFVSGDKIIFYDDLEDEENGEFPSRWDITKGNAENASLVGENVIAMKQYTTIMPLMDSTDYLPEVFTLEFDAFYDKEASQHFRYAIRLWPGNNSFYFNENRRDYYHPIQIYETGLRLKGALGGQAREYKTSKEELNSKEGSWKHISIAFNKRSLKIFIDQYRVLNIPNFGFIPKMFSISSHDQWDREDVKIRAIKNIRLAEGGKKLYDQVIAEGKFVTQGILFDTNKASLKPESMGVINKVAKLMLEHTDLNFNIQGHTDSDGDDTYNLDLSARRAMAVKNALVELGISANRMETEGKGESKPLLENTTPEGKANNRRVEFVKL